MDLQTCNCVTGKMKGNATCIEGQTPESNSGRDLGSPQGSHHMELSLHQLATPCTFLLVLVSQIGHPEWPHNHGSKLEISPRPRH